MCSPNTFSKEVRVPAAKKLGQIFSRGMTLKSYASIKPPQKCHQLSILHLLAMQNNTSHMIPNPGKVFLHRGAPISSNLYIVEKSVTIPLLNPAQTTKSYPFYHTLITTGVIEPSRAELHAARAWLELFLLGSSSARAQTELKIQGSSSACQARIPVKIGGLDVAE